MGNPISLLRKELTKADEEKRKDMEQRLQILEKMVTGRLENEMHHILAGERGDQEIHTGTVVEMHRQINITQKEGGSQDIKDAIGDFFSGDFIGGLENLVQLAANSVLGNASMGEYENNSMFIVWTSNALLRCDAYYYRWNFVSEGVIGGAEGCVGVLLVKRVIDATSTNPQVLTWAITSQAGRQGEHDDEEVAEHIDSAMTVIERVIQFQMKVKKLTGGGGFGNANKIEASYNKD